MLCDDNVALFLGNQCVYSVLALNLAFVSCCALCCMPQIIINELLPSIKLVSLLAAADRNVTLFLDKQTLADSPDFLNVHSFVLSFLFSC